MTNDQMLLRMAGEALYGPRWQSELARDLGVSDRTMRRWVAGDTALPPGVVGELLRLVADRLGALATIERLLRGAAASP